MNPIVPIIMALGAILFFVGIYFLIKLGFRQIKIVKMRGKEYQLWRFVLTTVLSGVALIMLSVFIQRTFPPELEPEPEPIQSVVSSNIKYELESLLSDIDDNSPLMTAVSRFQSEYQDALQKGDKKTADLLILEMAFIIRTELKKQGYSAHETEREVARIMRILQSNLN